MLNTKICIGSACHNKGAYNIIQTFQQLMEEHHLHDKVELKASFCMNQCQNAGACVTVGEQYYAILPEEAREFFETKLRPQLI